MAVIVFEVVALGLEDMVVLVLDLPAGPTSRHDGLDSLGGQVMVGDKGMVIEDFAGRFMGNGQVAPVDQQGLLASPQGQFVEIAITPHFAIATVPQAKRAGWQPSQAVDGCHPLVQRGVGIGLANEDEVEFRSQQRGPKRLMGVQVIAQRRDSFARQMGAMACQPAPGRVEFTVLFLRPILGEDKLWRHGNDLPLGWSGNHRSEHAVGVSDPPTGLAYLEAVGAVNRGRGKVLRPVEDTQQVVVEVAKCLQLAGLLEQVEGTPEDRRQIAGLKRVQ